jgi:uncharacterized protein YbbK (DUF523 family)
MRNHKVVVASSCLCGIRCRYHGKATSKVKTVRELEADGVVVIPVCPEMLGELPCPRPPVRTIKGRIFETDNAKQKKGKELTETFLRGAYKALEIAQLNGAEEAYFFKLSPSCAVGGVAGKLFREHGIKVHPIW